MPGLWGTTPCLGPLNSWETWKRLVPQHLVSLWHGKKEARVPGWEPAKLHPGPGRKVHRERCVFPKRSGQSWRRNHPSCPRKSARHQTKVWGSSEAPLVILSVIFSPSSLEVSTHHGPCWRDPPPLHLSSVNRSHGDQLLQKLNLLQTKML